MAVLEKVAPLADTSDDPNEMARAARALRALGRFHEANAAYRDASPGAPNDPAIKTAWGELFLEKYHNAEALKSFQMALQTDARWTPALLGAARTLADENPPQAIAMAKQRARDQPSSSTRTSSSPAQAADAEQARRSAAGAGEGAGGQSVEPRRARAARRDGVRRGQAAGVRGGGRQGAGDRAELRRGLSRRRRAGRAQLPLRRSGRSSHAAACRSTRTTRTLADLGSHLLRTGDEPAARAALEASFKSTRSTPVTKNLLDVMDKVDKFVTFATATS